MVYCNPSLRGILLGVSCKLDGGMFVKEHTVEEFRKAVTAGTPVEAIGRIYGLTKGPGESESKLAARIEMLLETKNPLGIPLVYTAGGEMLDRIVDIMKLPLVERAEGESDASLRERMLAVMGRPNAK